MRQDLHAKNIPVSKERLTHVQLLFTQSPTPHQSSKFPFEYLLLPPRSALGAVSLRLALQASAQNPMPSYSSAQSTCNNGWIFVTHFSAIHFRGESIRQVSYYTLLSRFQLPWPLSCCQDEPTPFMVSDVWATGRICTTLGSSLITSSAYQEWPTWRHYLPQQLTHVVAKP